MIILPPTSNHTGFRLTTEILTRSATASWGEAKSEWELVKVYRTTSDEPTACLCGHAPIVEVCVLENQLNGSTVQVGNVCVKKFLGLDSDAIFKGLRKVAKNPAAALTPEAVRYAHERGWLTDWELDFCLNTARLRWPSEKQQTARLHINAKVLARTEGRP